MRYVLMIWAATMTIATASCGAIDHLDRRSKGGDEPAAVTGGASLAAKAKEPGWFSGWDTLEQNGGVEYGKLPNDKQTPKTIKATVKKSLGSVKLLDYWLRDTGWTTMFGNALERYSDKNFRTDGVRWDTPTSWVPKTTAGVTTYGNMTLRTQFGTQIPSYWKGAQPLANQTDWIFSINYANGGIMEIFDRQHFGYNSNGTINTGKFGEVTSTSYYESLYWSPHYKFTVGTDYAFHGPAKFVGNDKKTSYGYSAVEIINRYDSFTVPPARNQGKDCKASEFKDVIALKHYQYWWDPKANTSRGDYMVIYMAKNVGWIYVLLNSGVTFNADGSVLSDSGHFIHYSPVGYISQSGGYKRICPSEFRDLYVKK